MSFSHAAKPANKVVKAPERLAPNGMFDFAFQKISQVKDETELKEEITLDVIGPVDPSSTAYGARFTAREKNLVLMSAACDDERVDIFNAGTTPLPQVLTAIRKLQEKKQDEIYLVPLAECQKMFGLQRRQHWTMLIIKNDESYFFDPRSGLFSASSVYSLKPLKHILAKAGFRLSDKHIHYLGWQKDDVNCGRFSAAMAEAAAKELFLKQGTVSSVQENLLSSVAPEVDELVRQAADCRADKRIIGAQAIREARKEGEREPANDASDNAAGLIVPPVSAPISRRKLIAAGVLLVLGFAALLTGIGAIAGIAILAGLATWAAATLTAVGGAAVLGGGFYLYNRRSHAQGAKNGQPDSLEDEDFEVVPSSLPVNGPTVPRHRPSLVSSSPATQGGIYTALPATTGPDKGGPTPSDKNHSPR